MAQGAQANLCASLKRSRKCKEILVSQRELYDRVIIGGGPGGFTANMYALRAALAAAHYVELKKATAVCLGTEAAASAGAA